MAILWLMQGPGLTHTQGPRGGSGKVRKQGLQTRQKAVLTALPHLFETLEEVDLGLRQEDAHTG